MSSGVESTDPAGSTKSIAGDATSGGWSDPGRSLSRHWYPTAAEAIASGVKTGELFVIPMGVENAGLHGGAPRPPVEARENRAGGRIPVVGIRPSRAGVEEHLARDAAPRRRTRTRFRTRNRRVFPRCAKAVRRRRLPSRRRSRTTEDTAAPARQARACRRRRAASLPATSSIS